MRRLTLLVFIFLIGCNSISYLVPEDGQDGVTVRQLDLKKVTFSVHDSSMIAFHGVNDTGVLKLFLFLKNDSGKDIGFIPDSVSVFGIEDDIETRFYTYNPIEYLEEIKTRQKLNRALNAMEETIEFANPENMTTTVNEDVTEADGLVDINPNTANEDKEENIKARQELEEEAIEANRKNRLEQELIRSKLLRDYTLIPGEAIFGDVMVKTKPFTKYRLSVPVGDDIHTIYFTLEKNEKQES